MKTKEQIVARIEELNEEIQTINSTVKITDRSYEGQMVIVRANEAELSTLYWVLSE